MPVTIDDVAKYAGVNKSTVSRALHGSYSISESTRKRIEQAVDELGYVGNLAAKMLASRRVNSIGVVFPPIADKANQPFFMKILTVINAKATANNVTVAIATGHSSRELKSQVRLMHLERRVDGFILLSADEEDLVRDYLQEEKVPFVVLGTPGKQSQPLNSVDNDNYQLGADAANYLIRRGHKKMVFFVDEIRGEFSRERLRGFLDVVGEDNCQVVNIFDTTFVKTDETAMVVLDDWLAISIIERLRQQSIHVPQDISVLSFNNSYLSKLIEPKLTTYSINIEQLGEEVVRVLQESIENEKIERVIVPFHLIERDSVRTITG
ncbi:MAG: LacI family transcriptional regulator [Streptococcaceae bacterium]|jgi:LacI family transcriptional regulator|nr:LacI family transcriptional regulator [Streptococcaceae bacterium]